MPSLLVLLEYLTPVTSFMTRTSAPAITLLDGSSTRPLMVPFGDCASRGKASSVTKTETTAIWGRRTSISPVADRLGHTLPLYAGRPPRGITWALFENETTTGG